MERWIEGDLEWGDGYDVWGEEFGMMVGMLEKVFEWKRV